MIKNPLSVVLGLTDILKNAKVIDDRFKTSLLSINKASKNIYSLLETLLNWSRLQTKSIQPSISSVSLDFVIKEILTLYAESTNQKSIEVEYLPKHKHTVLVDEDMINVVFRNLINNSIKFTHKQGKIIVSTSENIDSVIIEFIDNGIGITPENIFHLFENKVNKSTYGTDYEKGTGLGLIICKDLLALNNGKIEVESIPNQGSTFRVYLPKGELSTQTEVNAEPETESDIEQVENSTEISDDKPLILIVDDNNDIKNYIIANFNPFYSIISAADGVEALAKTIEFIPDLIITDLVMPHKSGLELCKEIRSHSLVSHIPVIILSAQTDIEVQLKSLELGAFDFIEKPFNIQMLLLKVRTMLWGRDEYKKYLKKQFATDSNLVFDDTEEDKFIKSVSKVLELHYSDSQFSVEKFAVEMGYSRSQLFRKLKAVLDISPVEYLKVYRLKRAKELLAVSGKRVSEIAYEVGFNDPMYFSSCFKSYYGQSPNSFSKK
ncbi:MAG: response regulator [Bacteroidales bacterium]|nr:response regulator [Bacteroidales bacterium]